MLYVTPVRMQAFATNVLILQEKRQAIERQLQELSQRVFQLELEKKQLQGALGKATSSPKADQSGSAGQGTPEESDVVLTFCFGEATPQLRLTRREVAALTVEGMACLWKRWALKMEWCMDLMAAAPVSMQHAFQQQIEDLVHELLEFIWAMAEHNLSTTVKLQKRNVGDPSGPFPGGSGDPRDWPAILARMQLSEDQARQLLAIRREMLREMGALAAEPDTLLGRLEVKEALSNNLRAMHVCRTFYLSYIHNKVLTPMQVAQYVVGCLPVGPDIASLLACLAQQSGEPSTEELMRAARLETAASPSASSGAGASFGCSACSGSRATSGAGVSSGNSASFGGSACSDSVAISGAGAKSGGAADSSLPPCTAGDWRQAFITPLRVLHGNPQQQSGTGEANDAAVVRPCGVWHAEWLLRHGYNSGEGSSHNA
ncbi:hypothetical protein COCOBI_06-6740 [Coccomyxa sp. Obi]|nr:hypothetical protein COCOBI_06-6680 [Coccomyxa sp. Obi]BDA45191.1 hypothetical protein COCOBI_06-6740 [Coccomyxa sp. Obi]